MVDNSTAFPGRMCYRRRNNGMLRQICFVTMLAVCFGSFAHAQPSPQQVDRFFNDVYFKFNPTQGTAAGFHQYDTQLEDYSKAATERQIQALHAAEKEFAALPESADGERSSSARFMRPHWPN